MQKIAADHAEDFQLEVLSGGMILPARPVPISAMADHIRSAYPSVEERTGIRFGKDFLWHIDHPELSDWFPSSEMPAIALAVFRSFLPDQQMELASAIQKSLFEEGRDLTDPEAYRHLVLHYRLPEEEFYERLASPSFKAQAYQDFDTCARLQVSGFPQLFCQLSDQRFHRLASGFTDEALLRTRIQELFSLLSS